MITSWQLYWLTRLDGFSTSLGIVAIVGFILSVFPGALWIYGFPDSLEFKPTRFRIWIKFIPLPIIAGALSLLVPSTKEMAAILIVPKLADSIASNKEIQKLPDNLLGLANEWIEELKLSKKDK